MSGNVKLSLLVLVFFLSGCAGRGGISRSQCGFQQDCNHHITYWQNAIDTVILDVFFILNFFLCVFLSFPNIEVNFHLL